MRREFVPSAPFGLYEWQPDFGADKVDVEVGPGEDVSQLFPDGRWEGRLCARAEEKDAEGRLRTDGGCLFGRAGGKVQNRVDS